MEKSDDEEFARGPGERWDPLGADDDDYLCGDEGYQPSKDCCSTQSGSGVNNTLETIRIRSLEDEQEVLTASLMALTSHFAQVQFRLRQIVEAPTAQRDQLLKSLEEFAFRGIPEVTANSPESDEVLANLDRARSRQFELIDRLKKQLSELEKFAYESGAPVVPQSILVEKQKIIIDELKHKLNLNVNDTELPQLTSADIRSQVDFAIGEFVGPLKMKEQLVAQLKTQIADLERFIAFLQHSDEQTNLEDVTVPIGSNIRPTAYNTYSAKKKHNRQCKNKINECQSGNFIKEGSVHPPQPPETIGSKTHTLLHKASALLQMFALTQFGSSSSGSHFRKNTLKKSQRINHWGDTRAQLEVDIQEVVSLVITLQGDRRQQPRKDILKEYESYVSDSDEESSRFISTAASYIASKDLSMKNFSLTNIELTTVVRKSLAVTLQKLIQHGLRINVKTPGSSLVPFMGCFHAAAPISNKHFENTSSGESLDCEAFSGQMHAWELILQYYMIKNGKGYNETPSRKLSLSFNLDISGNATTISNKQSLLSAIGTIIAIHKPYKRSYNSHFKAFVCAGLNAKKLVPWLSLIFQCNELINMYYMSWSYVAQTGFRDALHSLDSLTKYDFDLPIDLAVRQFQNIKDVFM